jgi:cytoskeletal protein CcmA (bactofilin family)
VSRASSRFFSQKMPAVTSGGTHEDLDGFVAVADGALIEGTLDASIVRISDGAQVEGAIAAQELTIGGRFKGTIQANRVTLTSSAVVEGEIHHRFLAIEENAWFAGLSRPEEASASRATDSRSSIQLVPTDGDRLINALLEKEEHADTATG